MGKHAGARGTPTHPIVAAALAQHARGGHCHAEQSEDGGIGWPDPPRPGGGGLGWPAGAAAEPGRAGEPVEEPPAAPSPQGWRRFLRRVA